MYESCLNLHFVAVFHVNIYEIFKKLLTVDNHVVCQLINKNFHYVHKDWFTGKTDHYCLTECVEAYENREIDKIFNNLCKIVIGPLPKK